MDEELMTPRDLSRLLQVSVRTLRAWRVDQTGPPWIRIGRGVRYRRRDVDAWLQDRDEEGPRP